MAQFVRFGATEIAIAFEFREHPACAGEVAAFDHQLAVVLGGAQVARRRRERLSVVGLRDVESTEFAVRETEVGEDVGMRAEDQRSLTKLGDGVVVAVFVDQRDRLQVSEVAELRRRYELSGAFPVCGRRRRRQGRLFGTFRLKGVRLGDFW